MYLVKLIPLLRQKKTQVEHAASLSVKFFRELLLVMRKYLKMEVGASHCSLSKSDNATFNVPSNETTLNPIVQANQIHLTARCQRSWLLSPSMEQDNLYLKSNPARSKTTSLDTTKPRYDVKALQRLINKYNSY